MSRARLSAAVFVIALGLASCAGGTPKCASGDVKENLNQIAENRLAKLIDANAKIAAILPGFSDEIRKRVSYQFHSFRIDKHDESADTYQCTSTLSVSLDNGESGNWEAPFHYMVYGVEGGSSDFEVEYEEGELDGLAEAGRKIGADLLAESQRKYDIERLVERLQKARDGGAAWSDYEKTIVDEIHNKKGEVPEVTPQQRAKSIEERVRLDDDPLQAFVNPPADVVAEIQRLWSQRTGRQFGSTSIPEDRQIEDIPAAGDEAAEAVPDPDGVAGE